MSKKDCCGCPEEKEYLHCGCACHNGKVFNRLEIEKAIEELNSFPLSENAQRLVNYLQSNIDDIEETFIE
jgi:hypothetical protein